MADIKKLTLLGLIKERAPRLLLFSMLLGLAAGICYSFIIPFLLHGIEIKQKMATGNMPAAEQVSALGQFVNSHYILIYFLICAGIVVARAASLIIVNFVVKDVTADLRIMLCRKINKINVREIEVFGLSRLLNILMDDINSISYAAVCLPMMCIEVVTITGLLAYVAFLDMRIFLCIIAALVTGTMMFHVPMRISAGYMDKSRSVRDQVQAGIRGILFGSYELKLNNDKAERYIEEEIVFPERHSAKLDKLADGIMHSAGNFGTLLSFLIIGLVALVLPEFIAFGSNQVYGVVMALLYLIGPIAMLLTLTPNVQRGNIALSRIMELTGLEEERASSTHRFNRWQSYRVRDIEYVYTGGTSEHENGFSLGGTSLDFSPGEVVFVVGGNGSGKSTLGKMLSLHYLPTAGSICFDDEIITSANIKAAREKIAIVYSHYFLFNKLYRDLSGEDLDRVNHYLKVLELDRKTRLVEGAFTTTDLSDGQRRRLALLVALMEDRDIYIFDEWAADQDPKFKEIFYTEIVPSIRNAGKLVIVITHDDRYFDCADRIVHMEDGRVRGVEKQHARPPRISKRSFMPGSTDGHGISPAVLAE